MEGNPAYVAVTHLCHLVAQWLRLATRLMPPDLPKPARSRGAALGPLAGSAPWPVRCPAQPRFLQTKSISPEGSGTRGSPAVHSPGCDRRTRYRDRATANFEPRPSSLSLG